MDLEERLRTTYADRPTGSTCRRGASRQHAVPASVCGDGGWSWPGSLRRPWPWPWPVSSTGARVTLPNRRHPWADGSRCRRHR
jgi:hypothetical protein